MRRTIAVLVASLVLAAVAHAQEPVDEADEGPLHEGSWDVRMDDGKGGRWTGRFELQRYDGRWTVAPAKGRDPRCDGKPTPVTIQVSNGRKLDMSVWGSSVAPPCKDLTIPLRVQPDGSLKATLADGRTVVLTRRPEKRKR
jgi:hypothetical protein